jgi:peptidyl-tRNA hydrolase
MEESASAWRFRCIRSERGEDLIDRWKNKTLSKKAVAKLERALEYLCVRPKTEWARILRQ